MQMHEGASAARIDDLELDVARPEREIAGRALVVIGAPAREGPAGRPIRQHPALDQHLQTSEDRGIASVRRGRRAAEGAVGLVERRA